MRSVKQERRIQTDISERFSASNQPDWRRRLGLDYKVAMWEGRKWIQDVFRGGTDRAWNWVTWGPGGIILPLLGC